MSSRELWIRRHLRRLWLGQFLERAGEWLAGFLLVFGLAVLLVRRMAPWLWPEVLSLVAGAVPICVIAWWLSRRAPFSRNESVALLDRSLRAGGLLMSLSEVPDADWAAHLPQVEQKWRESLPRIRPQRFASCVAVPLLFACGVCFVPQRVIESQELPPPVSAGEQAVQRLDELLTALQRTELFKQEEEQVLQNEIRKLAEEVQRNPLTHEKWETVDALEQRMLLQLTKAQLETSKLTAAASALAEALANSELTLTAEQLQQLEDDLLETLMKRQDPAGLKATAGKGQMQLQDLLERLTKGGTQRAQLPSDPGEREQLLADLQKFLEEQDRELSELRQRCQGGQCAGQCQSGELGGQCEGGHRPGRGGTSRGRGDAELSWGDEADEQGVRFKDTVLPPGFREDAKDEVLEVRLASPEVDPSGAFDRSAGREFDPTTGRETWRRQLRPRHKEVVRQYFDNTR